MVMRRISDEPRSVVKPVKISISKRKISRVEVL